MKFLVRYINKIPKKPRKLMFLSYILLTRAMTLGVRVIVVDDQGRIMLVRHTYTKGWHLPGGGVERGETVAQAAAKEVYEECNIKLTTKPENFHTYRNLTTSSFDHVALFVAREWESLGEKQPDHEIAETGFFALDDLPQGVTKSTFLRIAEVFEGRETQDYW